MGIIINPLFDNNIIFFLAFHFRTNLKVDKTIKIEHVYTVFFGFFYLCPVVLENNHAGLWIHTLQDQSLSVSASIGNQGGHRGERVLCGSHHVMSRRGRGRFGVLDECHHSHRMEDDSDGGPEDPERLRSPHQGRGK